MSKPKPVNKVGLMASLQYELDKLDRKFQEAIKPKKTMLPVKEQIVLLLRLAELSNEMTLTQALSHLRKFSKGKLSMVYTDMLECTKAGRNASLALEGWIEKDIFKGLVAAENRGVLTKALFAAAEFLEKRAGVVGPVVRSLIQPLIVLFAAMAIDVFMSFNILKLAEQAGKNPESFSLTFQVVFAVDTFARIYLLPLLALLVVGGIHLSRFLQNDFSSLRLKVLDKQPIFRDYRMVMVTRFLSTFCLLIDQGMEEVKAIQTIRDGQTKGYFARHLMKMEGRIRGGELRSEALNTGLFDDEAQSLLKAIGDTERYNEGLKKVSQVSLDRFLKNIAFYAVWVKVFSYTSGVVIALCVYGSISAMDTIFTS